MNEGIVVIKHKGLLRIAFWCVVAWLRRNESLKIHGTPIIQKEEVTPT